MQMITQAKIPYFPIFSDEAKSLLQALLVQDPRQRLGFNSIDDIKNHEFFSSINWTDVMNKTIQKVPEFKPLPNLFEEKISED